MMPSDTTNWRQLYVAATLAGAGLGVLLFVGALPAVPHRLTTWIDSVNNRAVALLVSVAGGAVIGCALAAIAHLGVRWQLRQRSKPGAD
jgi:hypothetical protein